MGKAISKKKARLERVIMAPTLVIIAFHDRFSSVGEFMCVEKSFTSKYSHVSYVTIKPRKISSIIKVFLKFITFKYSHGDLVLAVPRSNSRGLILLVTILRSKRLITYSDGLGDAVHECKFEKHPSYDGHVGFRSLGAKKFFYIVPPSLLIESWIEHIEYDPRGPAVVILKSPKEVFYDKELLRRQYARIMDRLLSKTTVLVSGETFWLSREHMQQVTLLPMLSGMKETVRVSQVIGLPSTAFVSFAYKLGVSNVKVMRLIFHATQYQAFSRYAIMRTELLEICSDEGILK